MSQALFMLYMCQKQLTSATEWCVTLEIHFKKSEKYNFVNYFCLNLRKFYRILYKTMKETLYQKSQTNFAKGINKVQDLSKHFFSFKGLTFWSMATETTPSLNPRSADRKYR